MSSKKKPFLLIATGVAIATPLVSASCFNTGKTTKKEDVDKIFKNTKVNILPLIPNLNAIHSVDMVREELIKIFDKAKSKEATDEEKELANKLIEISNSELSDEEKKKIKVTIINIEKSNIKGCLKFEYQISYNGKVEKDSLGREVKHTELIKKVFLDDKTYKKIILDLTTVDFQIENKKNYLVSEKTIQDKIRSPKISSPNNEHVTYTIGKDIKANDQDGTIEFTYLLSINGINSADSIVLEKKCKISNFKKEKDVEDEKYANFIKDINVELKVADEIKQRDGFKTDEILTSELYYSYKNNNNEYETIDNIEKEIKVNNRDKHDKELKEENVKVKILGFQADDNDKKAYIYYQVFYEEQIDGRIRELGTRMCANDFEFKDSEKINSLKEQSEKYLNVIKDNNAVNCGLKEPNQKNEVFAQLFVSENNKGGVNKQGGIEFSIDDKNEKIKPYSKYNWNKPDITLNEIKADENFVGRTHDGRVQISCSLSLNGAEIKNVTPDEINGFKSKEDYFKNYDWGNIVPANLIEISEKPESYEFYSGEYQNKKNQWYKIKENHLKMDTRKLNDPENKVRGGKNLAGEYEITEINNDGTMNIRKIITCKDNFDEEEYTILNEEIKNVQLFMTKDIKLLLFLRDAITKKYNDIKDKIVGSTSNNIKTNGWIEGYGDYVKNTNIEKRITTCGDVIDENIKDIKEILIKAVKAEKRYLDTAVNDGTEEKIKEKLTDSIKKLNEIKTEISEIYKEIAKKITNNINGIADVTFTFDDNWKNYNFKDEIDPTIDHYTNLINDSKNQDIEFNIEDYIKEYHEKDAENNKYVFSRMVTEVNNYINSINKSTDEFLNNKNNNTLEFIKVDSMIPDHMKLLGYLEEIYQGNWFNKISKLSFSETYEKIVETNKKKNEFTKEIYEKKYFDKGKILKVNLKNEFPNFQDLETDINKAKNEYNDIHNIIKNLLTWQLNWLNKQSVVKDLKSTYDQAQIENDEVDVNAKLELFIKTAKTIEEKFTEHYDNLKYHFSTNKTGYEEIKGIQWQAINKALDYVKNQEECLFEKYDSTITLDSKLISDVKNFFQNPKNNHSINEFFSVIYGDGTYNTKKIYSNVENEGCLLTNENDFKNADEEKVNEILNKVSTSFKEAQTIYENLVNNVGEEERKLKEHIANQITNLKNESNKFKKVLLLNDNQITKCDELDTIDTSSLTLDVLLNKYKTYQPILSFQTHINNFIYIIGKFLDTKNFDAVKASAELKQDESLANLINYNETEKLNKFNEMQKKFIEILVDFTNSPETYRQAINQCFEKVSEHNATQNILRIGKLENKYSDKNFDAWKDYYFNSEFISYLQTAYAGAWSKYGEIKDFVKNQKTNLEGIKSNILFENSSIEIEKIKNIIDSIIKLPEAIKEEIEESFDTDKSKLKESKKDLENIKTLLGVLAKFENENTCENNLKEWIKKELKNLHEQNKYFNDNELMTSDQKNSYTNLSTFLNKAENDISKVIHQYTNYPQMSMQTHINNFIYIIGKFLDTKNFDAVKASAELKQDESLANLINYNETGKLHIFNKMQDAFIKTLNEKYPTIIPNFNGLTYKNAIEKLYRDLIINKIIGAYSRSYSTLKYVNIKANYHDYDPFTELASLQQNQDNSFDNFKQKYIDDIHSDHLCKIIESVCAETFKIKESTSLLFNQKLFNELSNEGKASVNDIIKKCDSLISSFYEIYTNTVKSVKETPILTTFENLANELTNFDVISEMQHKLYTNKDFYVNKEPLLQITINNINGSFRINNYNMVNTNNVFNSTNPKNVQLEFTNNIIKGNEDLFTICSTNSISDWVLSSKSKIDKKGEIRLSNGKLLTNNKKEIIITQAEWSLT